MTGEPAIIEVENLSVEYRTLAGLVPAVRSVTFALHRGDSLGLVGESGSGKTTIGLAIMRHLAENGRIAGGAIRFAGTDLVPLGPRALRRLRGQRMAMVYQDPANALNPSLRVGSQIAEVYRHRRDIDQRSNRDRTIGLLSRVHLPDPDYIYDRYPHELSGGQQQRIVIAIALAMNPDVLILDEPTTGLDVTVEAEVLDLFTELRRAMSAAILFISHDIAVIAKMCDRIGVLYSGQFAELGPVANVLSRPSHPYTRSLWSARIPWGATKHNVVLAGLNDLPNRTSELSIGCTFVRRCSFARPRCRLEAPPLFHSSADRLTRCFFHEEVQAIPTEPKQHPAAAGSMRDSEAVVEVRNIRKRFGRTGRWVQAVAGATFRLDAGHVLGIVGESGSGKTTTVRIIAGLILPDKGEVWVEGRDVTRPVHRRSSDSRRAVQMVFQNPDSTLNPKHRVGNILGRTLRKLTGIEGERGEELVRKALRAVRLDEEYIGAFPEELSGGQRQRVAIARAFIADPRIVLCDEPTSALDVSIQASILALLVELQREKQVSYVFISHDLAVVGYIADTVAVMYLGEIVEFGPVDRVFNSPSHPYTETLLSAVRSLSDPSAQHRMTPRGGATSVLARPRGCPFHPRCPRKVGSVCETTPPWRESSPGHSYRCVITPDELRERVLH